MTVLGWTGQARYHRAIMVEKTISSIATRRPWLAAMLLGLAAFGLGSLAVTPARAPLGELGAAFADLARSPLGAAANPVPGRILRALMLQ